MNGQKPEAQAGYRVETFSLKNTRFTQGAKV